MQNGFSLIRSVILLFLFVSISSISKATLYDINVPVNSAQEVPPNASLGTATLLGTYNDVTNVLTFNYSFSNLSSNSTAAHFHGPAAVGVNAGVRIGHTGFPTGVTSGNYSNTFTLSASNETEMLSGLWYLNIHTTSNPGGEIRGQVYAIPVSVLKLTTLLEGFYDDGTDLSVRDTLTVNLRAGSSPYNPVESKKIFMKTGGEDSVKYLTATNGTNYFLQLEHRNALETWSAAPITFTGYYNDYDFSTSGSQAFGSNEVQKGSRYCLYSGDANSDGIVDINDLSDIDNDAFGFVGGYVVTDINGDDFIDLNDLSICDNNASNFVSVIAP